MQRQTDFITILNSIFNQQGWIKAKSGGGGGKGGGAGPRLFIAANIFLNKFTLESMQKMKKNCDDLFDESPPPLTFKNDASCMQRWICFFYFLFKRVLSLLSRHLN